MRRRHGTISPATTSRRQRLDELLAMVLRAAVEPGDTVAYPYPTYSLYDTLVAIAGATADARSVSADFSLPRRWLATDARVTFSATPTRRRYVRLRRRDRRPERTARGLLVVDEAYVDFAADSALRLVRERSNVIVCARCRSRSRWPACALGSPSPRRR
jgi:histidinol-phosphate aminotransferase